MADTEKTTTHTLRNTAPGPRGVNTADGYREVDPGATLADVDLTAGELKSLKRAGYFHIDGEVADDEKADQAAESGDALPSNVPKLRKIAKDEDVDVTGANSAADLQRLILAARAERVAKRGDNGHRDELDAMDDATLRTTVQAITGKEAPADADRAALLSLARGQKPRGAAAMAYLVPTAAAPKALYPAFASVGDATVTAHIGKASREAVDTTWLESDYSQAILDYAAHSMAMLGIGAADEGAKYRQAGVTRIRSGSFDASFSDQAVAKATGGGLDATPYGLAYRRALRRSKGGPRLVAAAAGVDDWGYVTRTNDGTLLPWGS